MAGVLIGFYILLGVLTAVMLYGVFTEGRRR
jgi:hypothetical protein